MMELETPNITENQKTAHAVSLAMVAVAASALAAGEKELVAVVALSVAALVQVAVVIADAIIRHGRSNVAASQALMTERIEIPDSPEE